MRIVIQRVKEAKVTVQGETIGMIGPGLCLFLGITNGDTIAKANYLAEKAVELRIFEDKTGKLNRSLLEVDGEVLIVSEFTLYGNCAKGRRPSFSQAAPAEQAEMLYNYFVRRVKDLGPRVATGKFQAKMEIHTINDGPVTFILDSR